ncbi:MAG: AAA family ATPase [Solirubrobacterales bacterium]
MSTATDELAMYLPSLEASKTQRDPEGAQTTVESERFKLLTLDDLDNLPDREYLIEGWVVDGLNVAYGAPGTKKSFVAMDQALCIAAGIDWLGHTTKQGPVVYIAAEGAHGLRRRRDAWMTERGVSSVEDFYIVADAPHLMDDGDVDLLGERLATLTKPPVEIVIDTLSRTMIGGDENTARDMGLYLANVDRIRTPFGAAAVVIHHTGWDGDRERGSIALRGAADLSVHVKADGLNITLSNTKNKDDAESEDLELHAAEVLESLAIRLGSNQSGLSTNERQILQSLPDAFGSDPAPASKLQAVAGVPERTYYRALQSLCERGLISHTKQGRTKLYSLTPKGEAALLATTAKACQTTAMITAATSPPLRGDSGSHRGSDSGSERLATDAEDALADRLMREFELTPTTAETKAPHTTRSSAGAS